MTITAPFALQVTRLEVMANVLNALFRVQLVIQIIRVLPAKFPTMLPLLILIIKPVSKIRFPIAMYSVMTVVPAHISVLLVSSIILIIVLQKPANCYVNLPVWRAVRQTRHLVTAASKVIIWAVLNAYRAMKRAVLSALLIQSVHSVKTGFICLISNAKNAHLIAQFVQVRILVQNYRIKKAVKP